MKVKKTRTIALIIILLALAGGFGLFIKLSGWKNTSNAYNITDIEEFLKVPEGLTEPMDTLKTAEPTAPVEEIPAASDTLPEEKEQMEQEEEVVKSESITEIRETTSMETPEKSTEPPDVNVNVEEIKVPKITPELGGGGISISGTIALEQAYYEEHNLEKAYKMARDILKDNPSDPTAKKILKLVELESKGNQALKDGDYQKAMLYFQKMQELDPNNIWAKKGIIRAQSGG